MRILTFVSAVCLALVATAAVARPAPTAKGAYERALARERALIARASAERSAPVSQVRAVIAEYESVVRRFPRSGYADNALWQAANLAITLAERDGSSPDRDKARELLTLLSKEYPSSSLAAQARKLLDDLEPPRPKPTVRKARPATAPPVAATPKPVTVPSPARGRAPGVPAPAPEASENPALKSEPVLRSRDLTPPAPAAIARPAVALPAEPHVRLTAVKRAVLPDVVRVTMELDGEVPFREERLSAPSRVFFDLRGARAAETLDDTTLEFESDIVRQIRTGRPADDTTRVVLDLDGVSRYSVFTLYNPYRIVVDLERAQATPAGTVATTAIRAPEPVSRPPATPIVAASPATPRVFPNPVRTVRRAPLYGKALPKALRDTSRLPAGVAPGYSPGPPPAPKGGERVDTPAPVASQEPLPTLGRPAPMLPPPAAPAANSTGGFSLARQLGLGVSRIVIDPGHGGHDPGALGKKLSEAELVLDVALRLEKLLLQQPGVEVVLTRRTDVFIPLEERTAIANRESADLFLSIHANASRNTKASGVETYFLNFATNPEAEAVAARENSASGRAMHNLPDIVKAIALNNKLDESKDFARLVQDAMVRRLAPQNAKMRDLGVKQAPFVVLIGAGMPSVLAEIAFVTNQQEGALLKTPGYRDHVAGALFDALMKYQKGLKGTSAVATQE